MKRIETTATVDETGTLSVSVPPDVAVGEHQVVLFLHGEEDGTAADDGLAQHGTLLVFTGELSADPDDLLADIREERLRRLAGGGS